MRVTQDAIWTRRTREPGSSGTPKGSTIGDEELLAVLTNVVALQFNNYLGLPIRGMRGMAG